MVCVERKIRWRYRPKQRPQRGQGSPGVGLRMNGSAGTCKTLFVMLSQQFMRSKLISLISKSHPFLAGSTQKAQYLDSLSTSSSHLTLLKDEPAQATLLTKNINTMITDEPKHTISQDLLTMTKHLYHDQKRAQMEAKKIILALNVALISMDQSDALNGYAQHLMQLEADPRQFLSWSETLKSQISTPFIHCQQEYLSQSYKTLCKQMQSKFAFFSQKGSFHRLYSVVSARILPIKLPSHIAQQQSPLILCPFLSEHLNLHSPFPNADLQGYYNQSQKDFYLKVVTRQNCKRQKPISFYQHCKGIEPTVRYGLPPSSVQLSIDFNGFEHLTEHFYELKKALIKNSILTAEISQQGIKRSDLSKLRIYCLDNKDRPLDTEFASKVSQENERRVKQILLQSCEYVLDCMVISKQNVVKETCKRQQEIVRNFKKMLTMLK